MIRCCICGKPLSADRSVRNGIGPICEGKRKAELERQARDLKNVAYFANTAKPSPQSGERDYPIYDLFKALKLPCSDYDCVKGECPWASLPGSCPRERTYIKKDIYPLYKHDTYVCTFCGKEKPKRQVTMHRHKTKFTIECKDCSDLNNSTWRANVK